MSDLHDRLRDAAGGHAAFPTDAIRARVRRRRSLRSGAIGVAAVALAVAIGMTVVPGRPAVDLQVGGGPSARPVDIDLAHAPTRLPEGFSRCGRVTHHLEVTVQRFCHLDGRELVLRIGPHDRLPEIGQQVGETRERPVYVDVLDGVRRVTVSDRRADDDGHYRAEAPDDLPTAALVDVIASVPAFIAATDDPTPTATPTDAASDAVGAASRPGQPRREQGT